MKNPIHATIKTTALITLFFSFAFLQSALSFAQAQAQAQAAVADKHFGKPIFVQ